MPDAAGILTLLAGVVLCAPSSVTRAGEPGAGEAGPGTGDGRARAATARPSPAASPCGTGILPVLPDRLEACPTAPPAEAYRISAGDTISILVAERQDLSVRVLVPLEGAVVLPGAGAVTVLGRTVEEVTAEVARLLETRARLVAPSVAVSLVSYGTRRAFVHGEVSEPRAIELPPECRVTLTQAVASSGGFNADADRSRVRLWRRGPGGRPVVSEVDAHAASESAAPEADPVLEPGDTVYVPKREPVYVLGLVKNPGAYPVPYGYPLTVSKAIALAGAWSAYARYTRVRVIRREAAATRTFTVDLEAVLSRGDLDKDMELVPGDTVFVPERVF